MKQSIRKFIWRSRGSVGTKLPGGWQLIEQGELSVKNELSFNVQIAYSSTREREREREICKSLWTDTKRHAPTPARSNSLNENFWPLTDWLTDYFFKIYSFYIFKYRISVGVMAACKIIASSLTWPKFTVSISPIKPVTKKIWIHFVYILAFLSCSLCTRLNFPFGLLFPIKDFS